MPAARVCQRPGKPTRCNPLAIRPPTHRLRLYQDEGGGSGDEHGGVQQPHGPAERLEDGEQAGEGRRVQVWVCARACCERMYCEAVGFQGPTREGRMGKGLGPLQGNMGQGGGKVSLALCGEAIVDPDSLEVKSFSQY